MGKKGEYKDVLGEYMKLTRIVMEEIFIYNQNPRLVDYEVAVAKYKSQHELLFTGQYTKRDVHTSVLRAIKELEKRGEIIHVGKYYYPSNMFDLHLHLEDFKNHVRLSQDTLAIISGTTYAIGLESNQNVDEIKKIIRGFLGEDRIFSLHFLDDVLFIIMKEIPNKSYLAELRTIIKATYDFQHTTID